MFIGTYFFAVSEKYRVTVPRLFREKLGSPFAALQLVEGRTLLMPYADLQLIAERRCDDLRDFNFSQAYELEQQQVVTWYKGAGNTNHRVIHLPYELRGHLGVRVGSEVAYVGVGEAVILCTTETWRLRYGPLLQLGDDERGVSVRKTG